jgi:hypothetical protein
MRKWRCPGSDSGDARRSLLRSVRVVAIGLAIAMVVAGIWVILTDRPSQSPGNDLIGMNKQCSGTAHIGVSNYHVQLDLTPSGYRTYAYVTLTRLPRGNGHCQLAAPIPKDATLVPEDGFQG